jgi:hypothetical protein
MYWTFVNLSAENCQVDYRLNKKAGHKNSGKKKLSTHRLHPAVYHFSLSVFLAEERRLG